MLAELSNKPAASKTKEQRDLNRTHLVLILLYCVVVFIRKVSVLLGIKKRLSDSAVVTDVVMRILRRLTVSVNVS